MEKQKELLWWLIWIDIISSIISLVLGFAVGVSLINIILLIPILSDASALYLLKKNKFENAINVALFSIVFSIYCIDPGLRKDSIIFICYVPVLTGIYFFDAAGSRTIKKIGFIYIGIALLLANFGFSPRLLIEESLSLTDREYVNMFYVMVSGISTLVILQLFSNLRKRSQNELEIEQANYKALLENSKDAVWSVDADYRLLSFNSVYAAMFRSFWHKTPKSGVSILFPSGKHRIYDEWNSWYRRAMLGETFTLDVDYRFREGHKVFEVSFYPILKNGDVQGTVVKANDVTQRKIAYREQQLISENLQLLLSSTQEIIFEMNEHDRCHHVWKGESLDLYYPHQHFLGKSVEELFDIPFQIHLSETYNQVKQDGLPRDYEYSFNVQGNTRHYIAKLRKIQSSKPARVGIVIEEITNRKSIELLHEQQSLFLNKLIAHLPIGVFVKSVKNNLSYTLWNKELEELFGLSQNDVLGKTDEEVFKNAGEIAHYMATDQMILKDKEPILIQKLSIQAGENQIYARTFKIPLIDADGNVESILGILENITDVVNSQQELENAEKRWNYALSGSRDAVWDVNLITDETFFSPVFSEMLGYKAFEPLHARWEELVHPEDLVRTWNLFVDHLEGKSHFYECEYRLRKKDGSYIWVLDRGKVAETDAEGNPTRVIGTFSNIDYRKRLEEEYKIALQKAEEASKAKSLFLSTMSHEIRTPMNGVIGIINLLLTDSPKPEQLDNLNALKYSADNLLYLLNDILDFSKIDAGKIELEETSFDLYSLLQNSMKSFMSNARDKGLQMELKASDNFPKALIGDALRLNQIFNNLISNAIKFTEKGKVSVEAITETLDEETLQVQFTFSDTGIGIDESYLPHIFEHFTQASSETTRKYGGTGLGLAICQRLVKILGGELNVSSQNGEGTRFWFSLKFKIDHKQTIVSENNQKTSFNSYPGMAVLLVEDNQMNVFVARKFLTKWEIQVDVAENGKEALMAVQRKRYDLILMDLQMPEMDGFESAALMRKAGLQTPIYALTANVNADAKKKVLECGMNDYLTKPFNPTELFQKIGKHFKPRKKTSENYSRTDTLF